MSERERTKPYAEDSTDGGSLINPLNYKGDVLVQVWMDSRVLATLCRWLEGGGTYSRFMSQVVRIPLETLASHLVDNDEVEMVDSTSEARDLLVRRFGIKLNRGGRGEKNILHNITLTDKRDELTEKILSKDREAISDVHHPLKIKAMRVQEAINEFNKSEEVKIDTAEDIEARELRMEELISGSKNVKLKMADEEANVKMKEIEAKDNEMSDALKGLDLESLKSSAVSEE